VLNKTLFEVFALVTGLGGVYYSLRPMEPRALLFDTVSAVSAIVALIIGVEHLHYVEEHKLLSRAIVFIAVIVLLSITMVVWIFGFQ
jgi:hypothetical protein